MPAEPMVLKSPEKSYRASSVSFSEGKATVTVPEDVRTSFADKLGMLLYSEAGFQKGSDLKIEYRFIQFNPGSQFGRWMTGGIGNTGEGSLTVEARFFDKTGGELCTVQCEGKIGSGFFGGGFDLVVEKAASEIVEYARQNFK